MKWDLDQLKRNSEDLFNFMKVTQNIIYDKGTIDVIVSLYTKIITGIGNNYFARDSIEYNNIENFCLSCNEYFNNAKQKHEYFLDAQQRLDQIKTFQIVS